MILGFPECSEALILAPHPDDEALGCAGTIALLKEKGVAVTIAFLTDGESLNGAPSPDVAAARREEARRCSGILGCGEPVFIGLPDGRVKDYVGEGVDRMSAVLAKWGPDLVLAPSPLDYHEDHLAASRIALIMMKDSGTFRLAFYEVYSTVRFTHLVDISKVLERKKEAILNYSTSLYGRAGQYMHAALGLNAHRSFFVETEGYYEAFCLLERYADPKSLREYLSYGDPCKGSG